jgi:hypothetical protein
MANIDSPGVNYMGQPHLGWPIELIEANWLNIMTWGCHGHPISPSYPGSHPNFMFAFLIMTHRMGEIGPRRKPIWTNIDNLCHWVNGGQPHSVIEANWLDVIMWGCHGHPIIPCCPGSQLNLMLAF